MSYQFPPDVDKLVRERMADCLPIRPKMTCYVTNSPPRTRRGVIDEDGEVIEGVRRGLEQVNRGLGRPFEEFDAEFRTPVTFCAMADYRIVIQPEAESNIATTPPGLRPDRLREPSDGITHLSEPSSG